MSHPKSHCCTTKGIPLPHHLLQLESSCVNNAFLFFVKTGRCGDLASGIVVFRVSRLLSYIAGHNLIAGAALLR